jgi:hypothetical protein
VRPFSVTISLRRLDRNGTAWWLSTVYGPTVRVSKTPLQLLHLILEEANAWMAAGFALLSSLLAAAGNPGVA